MDLNKLRVFVKVAELKSVTGAAKPLGISPATVSRYIASLQSTLKTQLYVHKGKYIEITEYGEHLSRISKDFIKEFEETLFLFEGNTDALAGQLKILCPYKLGEIWLLNKLDTFRETYPQIRFSLCFEDSQLASFLSQVDIAILPYRLSSGNFIQKLLFSSPLAFFASPTFLEKHPSLDATHFQSHCIVSKHDEGEFEHERPYLVDNHSIVMSFVQSHAGIGLIPEFLGKRAGLTQVSPSQNKLIHYYIAYHEGIKKDKKVSLFKEFLSQN
jgi:DNA-binding transcriptional LysR family regulator